VSKKSVGFGSAVMSGFTWMYLSVVLQGALKLFVLAILARLLGPRDFGIVGVALIFTSCAERVGQVGVGPALIQKANLSPDEMQTGMVLSVLSGVFIAASLWIIAPYAALFFTAAEVDPILKTLSFGFVLDGFGVLSDSLLQRNLRFRQIVVRDNISYVVGIAGVGVVLAVLGAGAWALVIGHLTMKAIRLVLLLAAEPLRTNGRFRMTHVRELLHTGVGFSLGRILNFMSLQGDNFVVGRVLGVEVLGMYTRGYQLMALPAMYIGQVLERVLFPAMAQKQDNQALLRRAYSSTLEVVALFALPTSIAMFFLAEEIVWTLFGGGWAAIVPVVTILSCGVFFRTAYKCSDTVVRSLGAVYRYAVLQGVYTVMIVGGSLLGSSIAGLNGVAVAVVLAVGVNYLLLTRLAASFLSLSVRQIAQPHLPGLWVAGCVGVSLMGALPVLRSLEIPPVSVVLVATTLSVLVGVLALAFAPTPVRVTMIPAALRRFPLERFGGVGRIAVRLFS
jgi:O-antigen/teichoic acid export membrane protein